MRHQNLWILVLEWTQISLVSKQSTIIMIGSNSWTICATDVCLIFLEMAWNFQKTVETCLLCTTRSAGPVIGLKIHLESVMHNLLNPPWQYSKHQTRAQDRKVSTFSSLINVDHVYSYFRIFPPSRFIPASTFSAMIPPYTFIPASTLLAM